MKFKYVGASLLASALILSACGQNNQNDSSKKDNSEQTSNNKQNNETSKKESNNNQNQTNQSQTESKTNQTQAPNVDTNSKAYLAQVLLTGLPDYRSGQSQFSDITFTHMHIAGSPLYGTTRTYPEGFEDLMGTPTAAGHVIYKNNGDGTINVYAVPSHFQDHRWDDPDYSNKEWNRILNNPKRVKLYDGNQAVIQTVASWIEEGKPDSYTPSSSSSASSSSEHASSSGTVTRANVIDKVEAYEGHKLDTSTYTFKEPEERSDGSWGFSILYKNGDLAGSYIVEPDGSVKKYDADGQEE